MSQAQRVQAGGFSLTITYLLADGQCPVMIGLGRLVITHLKECNAEAAKDECFAEPPANRPAEG